MALFLTHRVWRNCAQLQAEVKHHFLDMLSEKMAWQVTDFRVYRIALFRKLAYYSHLAVSFVASQLMDYGYQYAQAADEQHSFAEVLHCTPIENPVPQRQRILERLEECMQSEVGELF